MNSLKKAFVAALPVALGVALGSLITASRPYQNLERAVR